MTNNTPTPAAMRAAEEIAARLGGYPDQIARLIDEKTHLPELIERAERATYGLDHLERGRGSRLGTYTADLRATLRKVGGIR